MKKFILMIITALMFAVNVNAQGVAGTSKFTNNLDFSVGVGTITKIDNYFQGHTATAPIIYLDVDKYITPWFGLGLDARILKGTGTVENNYNTHTMIDGVNLSISGKWNIINSFNFTGFRKTVEPIIYVNGGWAHKPCGTSSHSALNNTSARAGVELDFNLDKHSALVLNTGVVWNGIGNGKLNVHKASHEISIGYKYHTGNWNKYRKPIHSERKIYIPKEVVVTKEVPVVTYLESFFRVGFDQNSAQLSNSGKAILDEIPTNSEVTVFSSASPEGSYSRNVELVRERTDAVVEYLESRGIKVNVGSAEDSRQTIIKINKK